MANKPSGTNALVIARPYDFDQPAGYDAGKSYPLIVLVHGFGANGFVQDALFGFNQLADARGVFVAHPDGTLNSGGSRFWNATDACCDNEHSGVDDVAYLNAVIDDMEANFNIDTKRVFFVGHSNGAFMSHRMACDSADRVAAIVPLAGDVWQDASKCNPSSPVAVAQVHGDNDTLVPYDGYGLMPSAKQSVGTWAQKNGCSGNLDRHRPHARHRLQPGRRRDLGRRVQLRARRRRAVDDPRRRARAVVPHPRLGQRGLRLVDGASETMTSVIFIHGMFVTPLCWSGWINRFNARGILCEAPAWPHHDGVPADLRKQHPNAALGRLTLDELFAHFEAIVKKQPSPPVLVGHSMGGLIVQTLINRGLGARGVAIDSAPAKGVTVLRWSMLRSNLPILFGSAPVLLSESQWRYAFDNTSSPEEAHAHYDKQLVPESKLVGRGALGAESIGSARTRRCSSSAAAPTTSSRTRSTKRT